MMTRVFMVSLLLAGMIGNSLAASAVQTARNAAENAQANGKRALVVGLKAVEDAEGASQYVHGAAGYLWDLILDKVACGAVVDRYYADLVEVALIVDEAVQSDIDEAGKLLTGPVPAGQTSATADLIAGRTTLAATIASIPKPRPGPGGFPLPIPLTAAQQSTLVLGFQAAATSFDNAALKCVKAEVLANGVVNDLTPIGKALDEATLELTAVECPCDCATDEDASSEPGAPADDGSAME